MVNDAIPFYEDGDELTATATVAVSGKTFVKISGDVQADGTLSVAPAGAGDKVFGVAMFDAAVGRRLTIRTIESGQVMPVVAGAALAANSSVVPDANGHAVNPAGAGEHHCVGLVLTGAANGADAKVLLSNHTVTI